MKKTLVKHLYLHIPFCESICSYCDFCRLQIENTNQRIENYLDLLISEIQSQSQPNQYQTVYLGGGTPNFLTHQQLERLLSCIVNYIDLDRHYEFTIECNPEFINEDQVHLFTKYKINRVSLGVQTLNDSLLKKLNRHHTRTQVIKVVKTLQEHGITNISCDFIYAIKGLSQADIRTALEFVADYKIPHLSYYALEIKTGSKMAAANTVVDLDQEADDLAYIKQQLAILGYHRYEVSNWALTSADESLHNKAYWLSEDWKAIGWGAHGCEQRTSYHYKGSLLNWKKHETILSDQDWYLQILMMGLRLTEGIDIIHNQQNKAAYNYYQSRITSCTIRNGMLQADEIDLLHDVLLNLID